MGYVIMLPRCNKARSVPRAQGFSFLPARAFLYPSTVLAVLRSNGVDVDTVDAQVRLQEQVQMPAPSASDDLGDTTS